MYELIRNILCPFEKIEVLVPTSGKILDIGCGHGILAKRLAKYKKRQILAIDPSQRKINAASQKNKFKNIVFQAKYAKDIKGKFDCITIMDVLYIMPNNKKLELLKTVTRLLKKDGILVLKEVNTDPKWMLKISKLEEDIMIKILGYTHSDFTKTHLVSPTVLLNLIKKSGLVIDNTIKFYGRLGYPSHILFLVKKK